MIQENEQKLIMLNRSKVEVTGVTEVVSFDNKEIILETTKGMMKFCGEELHVKRLTLEQGEVTLSGRIDAITYHESGREKTAGGMLSRLFR